MSDSIEIGDRVQVDFNQSQITLSKDAEVLHVPCGTGDGWMLKAHDTGFTYYVSEGCTISRRDS